jgi:DNA-binding CsgD family transcriptional regulator
LADAEQLIDRIYEAAALSEEWPAVLHDVAAHADAAGAGLLVRRSDAWIGWTISPGIAVGLDSYLSSGKSVNSIAHHRLAAADSSGFLADHQLFTEDEYMSDPVTVDWATPYGLHRGAAAGINLPGGDFAIVQVQRLKGRSKFEPEALAALDVFRPHIARAAMLAARWRLERLRSATEALAMVGLPAAVLDLSGRVITANSVIQDLRTQVVWRAGDRLGLADAAAAQKLTQSLAQARSAGGRTGSVFACVAGDERAVVHLLPLTLGARELFDGGYSLLVIIPIEVSGLIDATVIQGLFDLTQAEAKVARAIAEGHSLDEIGRRTGVSIHTVRTQAKTVLSKTGASRQAELAALLAGLNLHRR